MANGKRKTKN